VSIRTEYWLFEAKCPFHLTDHYPGLRWAVLIILLDEFNRRIRIHHEPEKVLIGNEGMSAILKTDNEGTTTWALNLERELKFVRHNVKNVKGESITIQQLQLGIQHSILLSKNNHA
jgi:hypothetical protein